MKTKTKICAFIVVVFVFVCIALPLLIVLAFRGEIVTTDEVTEYRSVAIVFGAGIKKDQTPSDALDDRLKVAADLYEKGVVSAILVSGDNSTEDYSEPDVMFNTLVSVYEIPEDQVFRDYAGRRTYDTCVRANQLWGIEKAYLVSQSYHLPRAMWTCERLGIESIGVTASLQQYVFDDWYKKREVLAIYKAFIDVCVYKPKYVGGNFLKDLDPN